MKHKTKKRSTSPNVTIDESSPKKLKEERIFGNIVKDEISNESKVIDNTLNEKKPKNSKKKTAELSKVKIEPDNEEVANFVKTENNTEFVKKKKNIIKTEKPEIKDEELAENIQEEEIENVNKVKKSKKRKSKEKLNDEVKEETMEKSDDTGEEIENVNKVKKSKKSKSKEKKDKLNAEVKEEIIEKSDETGEENVESKKKKEPSKRQLKREKKELREMEKHEAAKHKTAIHVLNYLSKWKHARSEWKFEKIKQAWLVNHLLNEKLVPDQFYPTGLEYFEGCKGKAKELLIKKAMDVIKDTEKKSEESKDAVESKEYQRARQLIQSLPTDT